MSTCLTDVTTTLTDLAQDALVTDVTQIPGLQQLWAQTLGDPRICVAVLDGPVDLTHPSLRDAAIVQIDLDEVTGSLAAALSDHGTHVTSVIFGSHDSPVKGIAPHCRGLVIPVFRYAADGSLEPCSQNRLAQAIRAAVRFGANVINISGGQFSMRGEASHELIAAVEACGDDVLIVAAAGNDGCNCLHVPGALAPVLAVGAMNAEGRPLPFSNWGEAYREQGVLALGERILGAASGGGVGAQSGTSFATPIVSGVAGLLLSLQQKLGVIPNSKSIRDAILKTTHGCDPQTETQCERVLAGRLNISGSMSVVSRGASIMSSATNSPITVDAVNPPVTENPQADRAASEAVAASACCGGCAETSREFVYAIGELDFDYPSLLREQSVQQNMDPIEALPGHRPQARHGIDFLRHLFGYQEVQILEMNTGHIEAVQVESSIYQLTIELEEGTFKLRYGSLESNEIANNANADRIQEALESIEGLTNANVRVVRNQLPDGQPSDFAIEFHPSAPRAKLQVSNDPKAIAEVRPIGRLRVTISSGEIESQDIGRQIAFNGISFSEGESLKSSVLNKCNSMIIEHVHQPDDEERQIVYVSTGELDSSTDLRPYNAHYFVPRRCRVQHEHRANMYDASAAIWKLNRGQMEVYGIVPDGNFAEDAYRELAEFQMNQRGLTQMGLNYYYYEEAGRRLQWEFGWDPIFNSRRRRSGMAEPLVQERSERVAIPGVLQGEVQLITGVRLPAINPNMRGTAEWSQARMLEVLLAAVRNASGMEMDPELQRMVSKKIRTILERLDHMVRNPGLRPEHRALNHAATRLFSALGAVAGELIANDEAQINQAAKTYELDDIVVKKSEIGYAGSDCWDVEVSFFNPENQHESLIVVSQTIDVNDAIPALTDKPRKFRRR